MSQESFSSVSTITTSTPIKVRAKRVVFEEGEIFEDISLDSIADIHLAIESILDKRIDQDNKTSYLIKWLEDNQSTWVAEDELYCCCKTVNCNCSQIIEEFNNKCKL